MRVSPARVARLRPALLRWYRRRRRRLPWRETRDPYAIWISEAMLQQTRVETVLRYWPRFLRRLPTVGHLARAREDSVLAQWSGLGYYGRARRLRSAARIVVERHGGSLPADLVALRALPGIGRYTAGAIASIAFGIPTPVVDGNVARVLARLFAIPGDPRTPAVSARLWSLAGELVPRRRPGDWNQALMELGATVCAPRSPDCGRCPVRTSCAAYRRRAVERFPQPPPRSATVGERRRAIVVEHDGHVLLVRRRGGLLHGLWEFPLAEELRSLGLHVRLERPAETIRHAILNRRIETVVVPARLVGDEVPAGAPARWFPTERLRRLPLSAASLRICARLEPSAARPRGGDPPRTMTPSRSSGGQWRRRPEPRANERRRAELNPVG